MNRLVRAEPGGVTKLLAAGDALRAAEADLLGGTGDRAALRAPVDSERATVDALVEAAGKLSPAVAERATETLHAAALDARSGR